MYTFNQVLKCYEAHTLNVKDLLSDFGMIKTLYTLEEIREALGY